MGGLTGQLFSGSSYLPDMAIASMTATGLSGFSLTVVENQAGTVLNFSGDANFINADIFGRVATNLLTPIAPTFYMINQNEAFVVGEIFNNPFFGILQPQSSGPFTASAMKGNVHGRWLLSCRECGARCFRYPYFGRRAGRYRNSGSERFKREHSGTIHRWYLHGFNSTAGFGAIALTSPAGFNGPFYLISPTQFVLLSTTTGDTEPMLIFVQQ